MLHSAVNPYLVPYPSGFFKDIFYVCVKQECVVFISVDYHVRKNSCKSFEQTTLFQVLENLNVYVTSSDHFRFCWFPHTQDVVCYHSSRTKQVKI